MGNNKRDINRGLMWGQLLAFLEMGKNGLQHAEGARMLLSADDQDLLSRTNDQVIGLIQRAWETKEAETSTKPKRAPARKRRRKVS